MSSNSRAIKASKYELCCYKIWCSCFNNLMFLVHYGVNPWRSRKILWWLWFLPLFNLFWANLSVQILNLDGFLLENSPWVQCKYCGFTLKKIFCNIHLWSHEIFRMQMSNYMKKKKILQQFSHKVQISMAVFLLDTFFFRKMHI